MDGDGVVLDNELARSAMDGVFEGLRALSFRTEKNEEDGLLLGAGLAGVSPGARLESFSRALIL